jgi:hypothetical protein
LRAAASDGRDLLREDARREVDLARRRLLADAVVGQDHNASMGPNQLVSDTSGALQDAVRASTAAA